MKPLKSAQFTKQRTSLRLRLIGTAALLVAGCVLYALSARGPEVSAQSTVVGDYDTSFASPRGYYVDPENPVTPAGDTYQTYFHTGELLPDGSIIAGGRQVDNAPRGDFYLRKFTPTGAVDTSFGTNGFVRTTFHTRYDGVRANDIPQVLKVQPDGKILFAGYCTVLEPSSSSQAFGADACVMRYNANGTLDQTFGGGIITHNWSGTTYNVQLDPGKVIFQTGVVNNGQTFGTNGIYYDMAIQPDGKIVLVGETRNYASFFVAQGYGAIVVRLNPNGSLDTTFGSNGIARWTAPEGPASCFPPRSFHGVLLQPDGRIIAVGYNSVSTCSGASAPGSRFVVTRWTAAGQLETVRHLDNETAFNFQDQGASAIHFTRDASKILVSGAYKNLGAGSSQHQPTMARFNLSDLSLDTTFGTGGIRQNNGCVGSTCGFTSGGRLSIRAIQPDGKILGVDDGPGSGNIVRFNPDGSPDQSFGNLGIDGAAGGHGRLRVSVTNYNGVVSPIVAGQILVRPNGKMNLIGSSAAHAGLGILRAAVSQNTSTGAQNPIDDAQTFAHVHYYDFLNREPDAPGLAHWTGEITGCSNSANRLPGETEAQCIDRKRTNTSGAFYLSNEFQNSANYLIRINWGSLGRNRAVGTKCITGQHAALDAVCRPLFATYTADMATLTQGIVVNNALVPAQMTANRIAFANQFVTRSDFLAEYPNGMPADQYIDKLVTFTGVALSGADRTALINEYNAPGSSCTVGGTGGFNSGRSCVLYKIVDGTTTDNATANPVFNTSYGQVYYNKEFNPAFVFIQYVGYLRRNPDQGGYDHWFGKLTHFGNFVDAEMVRSFLVSDEYRRRFGSN